MRHKENGQKNLKKNKKFIYLISPNKIKNDYFYEKLNQVLSSKKVVFFQLRLKNTPQIKLITIAKKIKKILKKYNVKLIINDNPKVTKLVNGDGCHVGQTDATYRVAKKILKNKTVGVTCHGSKKLINKAIKNNVDYIALGSFFKSKLKPNAKKTNKKIISWTRSKTNIPIVAIGGINDKNYKNLLNLGANYIAISSYIWNNPALKYKAAINKFI